MNIKKWVWSPYVNANDTIEFFQMADHFCNSIGVLQQSAVPGQFTGFEKSGIKPPTDQPEGM